MDKKLIILAALLHDIGKFAQRAEQSCSSNLEQEYCPEGKTHRHVLYSDYFIEKTLPLPNDLLPYKSKLARIASAHHKPDLDNIMEVIIRDADYLSSGGDRVKGTSGGNYKNARLETIFNTISLNDKSNVNLRHKLLPIDDNDAIFPVTDDLASQTTYINLWNAFQKDLYNLPLKNGIDAYIHSIQSLLEKWTWCIPSSTYNTRADISLFDHAYTTAAIAQALYVTKLENKKGMIFFGGDLSGIQRFIFNSGENVDKGAGKLLRARSFIIHMITRSLWMTLLRRCNLEDIAKIMDAGGKFLLLLPNTDLVKEQILILQEEAEKWFLEEYHGILRCNFASLEINAFDLEMKHFQDKFDEFNKLLEEAKLHPLKIVFDKGIKAALKFNSADYAQLGACGVCGLAPATIEDSEGRNICKKCNNFISYIGKELPNSKYAILARKNEKLINPKGLALFGDLYISLSKDEPKETNVEDILSFKGDIKFTSMPIAGYTPKILKSELEKWKEEKRFTENSEELYIDNELLEEGAAKTFNVLAQLAKISEKNTWRCVSMLGACKADIDNLGLIFSLGFGQNENRMLSISRYVGLSRMLHRFFSSWLVKFVEREFPNIYVVFAGGDDLFVIGPWPEIIKFSDQIQSEFSRFSGNNKDITISAGISLMKSSLPILNIKNMAEELLECSKNNMNKNGNVIKNSVTLFGVTTTWDEFRLNLKDAKKFEELCINEKISHGFIRRILNYARECKEFRCGDITKGLYLSHMYYDFERNCKNKNSESLSEDEINWFNKMPHENNFPEKELAATWALYRIRKS